MLPYFQVSKAFSCSFSRLQVHENVFCSFWLCQAFPSCIAFLDLIKIIMLVIMTFTAKLCYWHWKRYIKQGPAVSSMSWFLGRTMGGVNSHSVGLWGHLCRPPPEIQPVNFVHFTEAWRHLMNDLSFPVESCRRQTDIALSKSNVPNDHGNRCIFFSIFIFIYWECNTWILYFQSFSKTSPPPNIYIYHTASQIHGILFLITI